MPVYLTYLTAFVDDDGQVQFRDDLYGIDAKLADTPLEAEDDGRAAPGRASALAVDAS